jgi:2-methylaconitate cis-trans-isomerase PrpF
VGFQDTSYVKPTMPAPTTSPPQRPTTTAPLSIPATYIRGGTSKAVFFHEKDLPPPGKLRDALLLGIMGSPDPMQYNGMGGSHVVTSKIAIVRPSTRPDADVDYTFAQVGLTDAVVDYSGNCGNISSGVGPFAINEGLLKGKERWEGERRVVRIWNTGLEIMLVAHVLINKKTGRALEKGEFMMSGCPVPGAPILMDYAQVSIQEGDVDG